MSTDFDNEPEAAELLAQLGGTSLWPLLETLLGAPFRLTDLRGKVLKDGPSGTDTSRVPLMLEIEPLAWLESPAADPARREALGQMLSRCLASEGRYRMVARLHENVVLADYEALRAEHEALSVSEARYKNLAEHLEQRVREQVSALDESARQLYQAEKLASVGRLAAGVAHEINNPIGFVRSNLATAQHYLELFSVLGDALRSGENGAEQWKKIALDEVLEDFSALIDESLGGVDRVARIVTDLKGFSNIDRSETEKADIAACLRQACSQIRGRLPPGVSLTLEAENTPAILCLPGYLNQAFLNLLQNAVQAVGEGGHIRVSSQADEQEIRVQIEDDGCGMDPDVLPRIFDPFFTTREVGQGTGLGLTVVQDIIRLHGGRIEVESAPGKGSRFTLYLPF